MSQLTISDLPRRTELDCKAMSAVRGGTGLGNPTVNVYVPINVSQTNNMEQNTSVLNNSVIGPGAYLPGLKISPQQWGMNALTLPAMPLRFA